jgi:hypothetical protein
MMLFGATGFTLIIGLLLPAPFAVGAYVERLTDEVPLRRNSSMPAWTEEERMHKTFN